MLSGFGGPGRTCLAAAIVPFLELRRLRKANAAPPRSWSKPRLRPRWQDTGSGQLWGRPGALSHEETMVALLGCGYQ